MKALDPATMTLTHLGKALDRLPVDLTMGKAIVEAAGAALQCSAPVATIAAVSRVIGDGLSLFDGDRTAQVRSCCPVLAQTLGTAFGSVKAESSDMIKVAQPRLPFV
jgi:HrpA-like RNA helicase